MGEDMKKFVKDRDGRTWCLEFFKKNLVAQSDTLRIVLTPSKGSTVEEMFEYGIRHYGWIEQKTKLEWRDYGRNILG